MRRIIFATKNKGKILEINEIMKDLNIEVVSMEEAGINIDVVEDGTTFEENAIIKVKEIMKITDDIVMADDSGLEIDFLNKAPGVYSARFEGENTPYDIKNKKILDMLSGVPDEKRTARFVCVIAAGFPDGEIITTKGTVEGRIGYEIKGENGFGYDPIFYVPEYDMTTAQMPRDLKNKISHRGKALEQMKRELKKRLGELE
ncbi:MAG: XTP/dITP diphosphohydrolase [Epulopiscium sp.]|jgi:XTP/dITP diphosphohydrolase|uniref:dITP/XTP pyrophosphatase n=1 Tax=Defluviitalea raffinosedens TaxID=1450156 RepID=A0A7C8HGN3_9FIRM|nr:XTP/dITP diphosphatase [Defluviitalea raffinosedens]MBZ4668158.1 Nucleoside 5-triphosphatase RdgB (dHAPTP, dITP, XTP-specific) [Defluviitaleaceae bacterium]MDK2787501.1 XTP/dITP diphosphohydrolase [Candidatus Epulonipiscium sp.]KAE9631390.1 XTP/dITP diphosphatase [Defluviitalea raffinosedens]MBM7684839.1 XTP/dITP diphosphohydrolase [Defluviitalea raffinosedens]HHW67074.1 XTP/dITP diphosphatase [Candidatus Epulonipiscium sp.]